MEEIDILECEICGHKSDDETEFEMDGFNLICKWCSVQQMKQWELEQQREQADYRRSRF